VILANAIFSFPQALLLIAATAGIWQGRLWWERRQRQRREQKSQAHGVFVPRPIRPAVLVALGGDATKGVLGSAATLCFVLAVLAMTSTTAQKVAKSGVKPLSFPAPAGYTNSVLVAGSLTQDALPDLSHYVQWVYDRVMFPYRSLHDASPGRDNRMRDYKLEKGRIVEVTPAMPVLDQEFVDQVLLALDKAPGNAIEQVLKKQGGFREMKFHEISPKSKGSK
jgi:hypothetical protein